MKNFLEISFRENDLLQADLFESNIHVMYFNMISKQKIVCNKII